MGKEPTIPQSIVEELGKVHQAIQTSQKEIMGEVGANHDALIALETTVKLMPPLPSRPCPELEAHAEAQAKAAQDWRALGFRIVAGLIVAAGVAGVGLLIARFVNGI